MKFPTRSSAYVLFGYILSSGISAQADQVIFDDLIVNGSMCVGETCEVDQEFSYDTLRIEGANPQIHFQDTSNSAGFPTNDWLMKVESVDAESPSVFSILDVDSMMPVLQLGAGNNGGVAIGAGAQLVEGAISFGSESQLRRVTYVADAEDPTDAVTKQQLDAEVAEVNQRVQDILDRLNEL